jgi:hypothetical protein
MPGSRPTDDNGVLVQCISLDEYFRGTRLDYVKFDIEGAERDALSGTWSLIERDRPSIALAIYHRPEDIFDLPLTVMTRTRGYRYFLRSHDHDGIDFVLYAIPEENLAATAKIESQALT